MPPLLKIFESLMTRFRPCETATQSSLGVFIASSARPLRTGRRLEQGRGTIVIPIRSRLRLRQARTTSSRQTGSMSSVKSTSKLPMESSLLTCVEIKILFVLNRRVRPPRHRRNARSMAWRCGSSPPDRARMAASSPRSDLVKNCQMHPTHWLMVDFHTVTDTIPIKTLRPACAGRASQVAAA